MEIFENFLVAFVVATIVGFLSVKYPKFTFVLGLACLGALVIIEITTGNVFAGPFPSWEVIFALALGIWFGDNTGKWIAKKTQKTPPPIKEEV